MRSRWRRLSSVRRDGSSCHVATIHGIFRKSGTAACPAGGGGLMIIAAILGDAPARALTPAALTDSTSPCISHRPGHQRMIFERMQVRQVEIDDLLFLPVEWRQRGADGSGVTSAPAGSAAPLSTAGFRGGLALGLFVPRFGRLYRGAALPSLGGRPLPGLAALSFPWAASA